MTFDTTGFLLGTFFLVLTLVIYRVENSCWWITRRYVSAALAYAEACDYLVLAGPCCGFEQRRAAFFHWSAAYKRLGYDLVPDKVWEDSVVFGRPLYKKFLYLKTDVT